MFLDNVMKPYQKWVFLEYLSGTVGIILVLGIMAMPVTFIITYYEGLLNEESRKVTNLTAQVDYLFVGPVLRHYKKKFPKATTADLEQVQFLAEVLVEVTAQGKYKNKVIRVDPKVLWGLLLEESKGKVNAMGPFILHDNLPALGPYQVNPINTVEVKLDCPDIQQHLDLLDIHNNTCAALSVYSRYLQRYGQEDKAILAYLAGPENVDYDNPKQKTYLQKVKATKKEI